MLGDFYFAIFFLVDWISFAFLVKNLYLSSFRPILWYFFKYAVLNWRQNDDNLINKYIKFGTMPRIAALCNSFVTKSKCGVVKKAMRCIRKNTQRSL